VEPVPIEPREPPPAPDDLIERAAGHLDELCRFPDRRIGGAGNHAAVTLVADVLAGHGFTVEAIDFEAVAWEPGPGMLEAGARRWPVHPGPYTNPCDVRARLAAAGTLEELEDGSLAGSVVLLHGALVAEQLPPKGFPYYEAPELRRILAALEAAEPAAIVAATGRNPGFAGSMYPFPLIEDAAVEVPHAYLRDIDGTALLAHVGVPVHLRLVSRRLPATGRQLIGRRGRHHGHDDGGAARRVVVFAHIDSKQGSPGAIDNASGVAVLLALAELLRRHDGPPVVELVPLNGEDDYATPGEKLYVHANAGRWDEIVLGVNIDAAGARGAETAISLYGMPGPLVALVRDVAARHPGLVDGEPWFESDHGLFLMHGRPALAITSTTFRELCSTVTHTERDARELADPAAVVGIARFLADLVAEMGRAPVVRNA
jgi:aminopeptidase YwaD